MRYSHSLSIAVAAIWISGNALAASDKPAGQNTSGRISASAMMSEPAAMPPMDAARGRQLFAGKGCVVCHAINGIGGRSAPQLDAATRSGPMTPFGFAAGMWRGADAMIYMQRDQFGEQITFTGNELADIFAFVQDADEQKRFSQDDIPPRMADLIEDMEGTDTNGDRKNADDAGQEDQER